MYLCVLIQIDYKAVYEVLGREPYVYIYIYKDVCIERQSNSRFVVLGVQGYGFNCSVGFRVTIIKRGVALI